MKLNKGLLAEEIKNRYLNFFEKRGHININSASLIPENDNSTLFTVAGMQPLVPYLLGKKHSQGKRLVNYQNCIRTNDIDEVGDNTHLTFFQMLGNWSLGDYFKKESINWSLEFLISKEEGLGLLKSKIYITCFAGDLDAPKDIESFKIWQEAGISDKRIYFLGAEDNFWSPGDNGPCGPDTEIFYNISDQDLGDLSQEEFLKACQEQKIVEIWNNVFMEYEKKKGKIKGKLTQKNVDTGMGLERITAIIQGKNSPYETDLFIGPDYEEPIKKLLLNSPKTINISLDHLRAALFLIKDGIVPSNKGQGYVLRRLIRKSLEAGRQINALLIKNLLSIYEPRENLDADYCFKIIEDEFDKSLILSAEREKFLKSFLRKFKGSEGDRTLNWLIIANQKDTFENAKKEILEGIFSKGFLKENLKKEIAELIKEGKEEFENQFDLFVNQATETHKETSKKGLEAKFKGGLAGESQQEIAYHTATHLLLAALRKYISPNISQKGSNINQERTRFDFNLERKMTDAELIKIENYVNEVFEKECLIEFEEVKKTDAQNDPEIVGSFWHKYPDIVKIYTIKDQNQNVYSKELCGGPHLEKTNSSFGKFKIIKQESVSRGIKRVKAVFI